MINRSPGSASDLFFCYCSVWYQNPTITRSTTLNWSDLFKVAGIYLCRCEKKKNI